MRIGEYLLTIVLVIYVSVMCSIQALSKVIIKQIKTICNYMLTFCIRTKNVHDFTVCIVVLSLLQKE